MTAGHLSIATSPSPASSTVFLATQHAANASVSVAVPLAGGGTLHTETIIARAENVLIVTLWTSGTARTLDVNASVAKLPNGGCYWSDQDVRTPAIYWLRVIYRSFLRDCLWFLGLFLTD